MDNLIISFLNGLALKNALLDALAIALAKYFPYLLVGVLFLFLVKDFKKYRPMVVRAISAGALSTVATLIIRFFWHRPRPFALGGIDLLVSHSADSSLPSLHATFFFALSTIVLLYNKKAGLLFFAASTLIGVSRVFCGLHWLSDILAGLGLGILSGLFIQSVLRRSLKNNKGKE